MYRAMIAGTIAVLAGWTSTVHAQAVYDQSAPATGSAASLSGIEGRSIQQSFPQTSRSTTNSRNGISRGANSTPVQPNLGLDPRIQLEIRPDGEGRQQQGVFPVSDTSKGNQVQVLYQLNQ